METILNKESRAAIELMIADGLIAKDTAERYFPELKESKGEKTKRILHSISSKISFHLRDIFTEEEFQCFDAWSHAWLEKQREQKPQGKSALEAAKEEKVDNQNCVKPADKVEPKFKVGDFIVNDYCMGRIVEITNDAYLLDTEQGIPFSGHSTRLWDITKDAKEGDVLADRYNNIGIFQEREGICWHSYIYLGCDNELRGFNIGGSHEQTDTHPATKEQHDTLMKAMADAGYTFDFEKKELKKIEQNPTWSEEDEQYLLVCKNALAKYQVSDKWDATIISRWLEDKLKSLKERVQPQDKQEWSEEDKNMLQSILDEYKSMPIEKRNWLKSLKPQSTWKPSDEQMKLLNAISSKEILSGYERGMLVGLYTELQKLREE